MANTLALNEFQKGCYDIISIKKVYIDKEKGLF